MGYHRAGFEIVGVDIKPQPHYPFELVQADALKWGADAVELFAFDAIHASPPCQAFTAYKRRPDHVTLSPDLIGSTRALLRQTGLPYVIENVKGAPLQRPVMVCGSMFDPVLGVRRHRYFETSWRMRQHDTPWPCRHDLIEAQFPAATNRRQNSRSTVEVGVWRIPLETQKQEMGVDWDVTLDEL